MLFYPENVLIIILPLGSVDYGLIKFLSFISNSSPAFKGFSLMYFSSITFNYPFAIQFTSFGSLSLVDRSCKEAVQVPWISLKL